MTIVKIRKQKSTKKCVMFYEKLKFENCKNCLEASQIDGKINYLKTT